MFTKSKEKEEKTSKNNKKRNIILIVAGLLLLIVILFLLWFFNRKFEVTFDYNNGTKEEVVYVKYNKTINSKDVKTKEDLGEQFIDWYLILEEKDGKYGRKSTGISIFTIFLRSFSLIKGAKEKISTDDKKVVKLQSYSWALASTLETGM